MSRVERPSVEEHIKQMQDFLTADRDADIAMYQEMADEAAACGDSFSKMYQDHADRLRARRFSWEIERESGKATSEAGR